MVFTIAKVLKKNEPKEMTKLIQKNTPVLYRNTKQHFKIFNLLL